MSLRSSLLFGVPETRFMMLSAVVLIWERMVRGLSPSSRWHLLILPLRLCVRPNSLQALSATDELMTTFGQVSGVVHVNAQKQPVNHTT